MTAATAATWLRAPVLQRVVPFMAFMLLLMLRAQVPADGAWGFDGRWVYGLGVLVVGSLLIFWRRDYGELSGQSWPTWRECLLAVLVGLAVFMLWINLDAPWMSWGLPTVGFKPINAQGELMWALLITRWVGAALLVPVMEELFWRSFLMRWLQNEPFEGLPPQRVGVKAVVLSTFVFMLAHTLWLAAVVAGVAYAYLYIRTGKLWVAVMAHAVTNGVLGVWVVVMGNWGYW
jgi:uncharacterized protein